MVRGSLAAAALALFITGACQPVTLPNLATPTPTPERTLPQRGPLPSRTGLEHQEHAVDAVLASGEVHGSPLFAIFPKSVGSQKCDIPRGGPAMASPVVIPGTCRTEVEMSGPNDIVKFTQTWDASVFHGQDDPSSGQLSTTWSFLVTPTGGVSARPSSGNFPPQMVR